MVGKHIFCRLQNNSSKLIVDSYMIYSRNVQGGDDMKFSYDNVLLSGLPLDNSYIE